MYTYLVGWSKLDRWYYGVRIAHVLEPKKDLWHVYQTSSEAVRWLATIVGPPDVVEVRRLFRDESKARRWETRVLYKLGVYESARWLNGVKPGRMRCSDPTIVISRNKLYTPQDTVEKSKREWEKLLESLERDRKRMRDGKLTVREKIIADDHKSQLKVKQKSRKQSSELALPTEIESLSIDDFT